MTTGCALIPLTRPVAKIGLIAPFEGQQRAIGYEALYAVKLALGERNEQGGAAGWSIELTALDSSNHASQALRQTLALSVDPDIVFALAVAAPSDRSSVEAEFAKQAMPNAVVSLPMTATSSVDPAFAQRYRAVSGGIEPGALAVQSYAATRQALDRIAETVRQSGKPAR